MLVQYTFAVNRTGFQIIEQIEHCAYILKLNSVAIVRKRTVLTERPPLFGEVSANLCG
jgi:hypothetical protein